MLAEVAGGALHGEGKGGAPAAGDVFFEVSVAAREDLNGALALFELAFYELVAACCGLQVAFDFDHLSVQVLGGLLRRKSGPTICSMLELCTIVFRGLVSK